MKNATSPETDLNNSNDSPKEHRCTSLPEKLREPGECKIKYHRFFILKHDKNILE